VWRVTVYFGSRNHYLGTFGTEIAAANAHDRGAFLFMLNETGRTPDALERLNDHLVRKLALDPAKTVLSQVPHLPRYLFSEDEDDEAKAAAPAAEAQRERAVASARVRMARQGDAAAERVRRNALGPAGSAAHQGGGAATRPRVKGRGAGAPAEAGGGDSSSGDGDSGSDGDGEDGAAAWAGGQPPRQVSPAAAPAQPPFQQTVYGTRASRAASEVAAALATARREAQQLAMSNAWQWFGASPHLGGAAGVFYAPPPTAALPPGMQGSGATLWAGPGFAGSHGHSGRESVGGSGGGAGGGGAGGAVSHPPPGWAADGALGMWSSPAVPSPDSVRLLYNAALGTAHPGGGVPVPWTAPSATAGSPPAEWASGSEHGRLSSSASSRLTPAVASATRTTGSTTSTTGSASSLSHPAAAGGLVGGAGGPHGGGVMLPSVAAPWVGGPSPSPGLAMWGPAAGTVGGPPAAGAGMPPMAALSPFALSPHLHAYPGMPHVAAPVPARSPGLSLTPALAAGGGAAGESHAAGAAAGAGAGMVVVMTHMGPLLVHVSQLEVADGGAAAGGGGGGGGGGRV
jgi:hypothetical protein